MHVEFLGVPRERAGIAELDVQADTLGRLLGTLAAQMPGLAELIAVDRLHPSLAASLNGDRFISDPDTPLERRRLRADSVGRRRRVTRDPFGYHGCYLRIDVSDGSVERMPLADAVLRQFIGGSGLGVRLLLDEGCAHLDPLDPAAPLVFAFSPLVGSPLTTSAKFAVVSKSPLTDRINDSLASSGFAIAGKSCGCDAIVIVGRAPELSVLIIDDGQVRVESAAECAGKTCQETEAELRSRLGANFRIAAIGPAGERLVRYATISHDGRHAGRGGSGAVLGAKNIKAIAVQGTQRAEWAHPRELTAISKDLSKRSFGPATAKYRELGTATNLLTFNRFGALPTRNFQSGHVRRSGEPVSGAAEHHAVEDARQLRGVHDRLRAYLLARTTAASASSTKACSRSARCAESATPKPCCGHHSDATSSASTPSAPAGRSRLRWSASSGDGSTSHG